MLRTSVLAIALAACGGGGGSNLGGSTVAPTRLDAPAFLLDFSSRHVSSLAEPSASIDDLETGARTGSGDERRAAMRSLAVAHLHAAEQAGADREASRERREAIRWSERAARGTRDEWITAEMAFVRLWVIWRGGSAQAGNAAERFTDRYRTAGELFMLAWIMRGEIALEHERWDQAATAYRYVLGDIEHPLYAFALYRTARCVHAQGRTDEARDMLEQVRQMGCPDGAAPEAVFMASLAAHELRTEMVECAGVLRPESCGPCGE